MTHPQHGIVPPNREVHDDTERLVDCGAAPEDAGWNPGRLVAQLAMDGEDGRPDYPLADTFLDPRIEFGGIS